MTFDGTGSSDPDGSIATAAIDFGDGTSSQSTGEQHTYTRSGTYTATLTVTDDDGATAVDTRTITVAPENRIPVADPTATPVRGATPLKVDFDGRASRDDDGSIVSWHWDFGDGGSEDGEQVSHTYTTGGTFAATLLVTDDEGAVGVGSVIIKVKQGNRAPEPADDTLDAQGTGALDVLLNDRDPDEDPLHVAATGTPDHGTASCAALGGCLYTPDAGYEGDDAFTYTVADSDGLEKTATVTVHVTKPATTSAVFVARDDAASMRAGDPVTVHVFANDTGSGLHLISATDPHHGAVDCNEDGTCVYTPAAAFTGSDGFTYTVENDQLTRLTADVHLTVAPATAGYGVKVGGAPAPSAKAGITQGQGASWSAAVSPSPAGVSAEALAALPRPAVTAELTGEHAIKPSSVRTARGWTAGPVAAGDRSVHASAGGDALLGEVSDAIPKPVTAVSQGTGGDGHVPILVGSKVFAFFHHSSPTQVTCVDRSTGSLCPGYPMTLNQATTNIPGPAAVVGSRIYVHLVPTMLSAQAGPQSLFCWDTAKDRTCGLIVVDRLLGFQFPTASAPILLGGKIWFGGDGGRLYCVDPATNAPCATTPSLPTGLDADTSNEYDIVGHGTRAYISQISGRTACVDVAAGGPCSGWALPRQFDGYNVVTHHSATGAADGVCVLQLADGECFTDADPGVSIPLHGWPAVDGYYGITADAEAGTRTLIPMHGHGGLGCWDWTTMAPCIGGEYIDGWLDNDKQGQPLPMAYGAAWDGNCAVGLGDPGLVFTVDPAGHAPCTTLGAGTEPRTIDLRDQRCDGTVGGAAWQEVALADTAPGELASVTVTVRDAATHALLATKDITSGKLDLSGIDAKAHPAIEVEANAISTQGDPAWADAIAPRIRVAWKSDPAQLCFDTTTAVECASPLAPVGVKASVDGSTAKDEKTLDLARGACPPKLGALPDRSVAEETKLDAPVAASDPNGGPLKFSLAKAPPGMSIDGATGRIAWTPSEAQGPGTYDVTLKVADAGGLTDQAAFKVSVTEVNRPPVLAPLADAAVGTGTPFAGRASATDPDAPANHLAYSLVDPPAGASIDRTSGAIAWTSVPTGAHALKVRVTDDGAPPLSAERSFTVTGRTAAAPRARASRRTPAISCSRAPAAASCSRTSSRPAAGCGSWAWRRSASRGAGSTSCSARPARSWRTRRSGPTARSPRARRCRRAPCATPTARATRHASAASARSS